MVYPVGETAKLPGVVKISGKKMFPSASVPSVPNCAVYQKANKNIDEGGQVSCSTCPLFVINIFR